MFQCRNQRRVCIPYVRLLTTLFFRAQGNISRRVTSLLTPKILDNNAVFYKLALSEKKKKTNQASTSRAQLEPKVEKGEDVFWDNFGIKEDEPQGEEPALQEEATQSPPPLPRDHSWEAFDALNDRIYHSALVMEEMRRNQEVLIRDLGAHFSFPFHKYYFYYPPPS